MKRPQKACSTPFAKILAVWAIFVVQAMPTNAQALFSVLPEEPPSSLFATKIGDSDVEVFAQGFWEASVLSTGAWSNGSADSGFNAVPFLFTQTPDLYTLLRFRQKWSFEAYVTQEASDTLFSLGYTGDELDYIKSARLGNAGISFPDYPYMGFGLPEGSFGAALNASDPDSGVSFDAMVRWDGLTWESREFFGSAEARESEYSPRENLRGRRFVLDDVPVTTLQLTDTYAGISRVLKSDEYSVSFSTGLVQLAAEPRGTLRADWTGDLGPRSEQLYSVSHDSDGSIVRTGSTYEARNLYAVTDTGSAAQLFVRSLATGQTDTRFEVRKVGSNLADVVLLPDPAPGATGYMQPFAGDSPWIYDDVEDDYPAGDGFAVVARVVESVDSIILGDDTVAGTITVYRNGVGSSAFSYDEQTHTLELLPPPGAGESIQVRYAVTSADRSDGALAFGLGARWPWLGLDWSGAIGGRWPLFGTGYDEGGELKSAWTGVSASAGRKGGRGSFEVSTMARYQRAGSTGMYRVAGMEDIFTGSGTTASWIPSFRPVEGDTANVTAASVAAADLSAIPAFAETITDLHPGGTANRALVVTGGGIELINPTRFIRYIDPAPLSSFGKLSFYLDVSGVAINSTLQVSVGNGTDGAVVEIDLDAFDTVAADWIKVEMSLNTAAPSVTFTRGDGSSFSVSGTTASYSIPGTAGLVEISVTGLTAGTVSIDEIMLEEPADGFSGLADASFTLGDPKKNSGLYAAGKASGVFDKDTALAGIFKAGWTAPFVSAAVDASPSFADGNGALGLGYQWAFPDATAPTRYFDSYSRDETSGRYARKLESAIAAGKLSGTAGVSSSEDAGAFSQEWKAKLGAGRLVSLSAQAGLAAPVSVLGGMGFTDAWLESWRLTVPAAEASANSRRFELTAALLDSSVLASASHTFAAGSPSAAKVSAKASTPFTLGPLTLSPFYIRESSVDRVSGSASFGSDVEEFADAVTAAAGLWTAVPVAELWNQDAFEGFDGFSSGASSATHSSGLGVGIRRPIGFGLLDLLVPSAVETGVYRKQSMQYDTVVETGTVNISLAGAADRKSVV